MIEHHPCPRLAANASAADAIVWLRAVTNWIGPAFHPDTPANQYIKGEDDSPTFTPAQTQRFDSDLDRSIELLAAEGRNPYDVAIKVQRRLLGIPLPLQTC